MLTTHLEVKGTLHNLQFPCSMGLRSLDQWDSFYWTKNSWEKVLYLIDSYLLNQQSLSLSVGSNQELLGKYFCLSREDALV